MRFERSFRVGAPVDRVVEFHSAASGLEALTPPWAPMQVLSSPQRLAAGDRMTFRLWLGPLPVRWRARIEAIDGPGFADVQEAGPFAHWRHEHRFEADGAGATKVIDRIEARLARHPLWGPVGLAMWLGLPALFAYRRRRTRRLLEEAI